MSSTFASLAFLFSALVLCGCSSSGRAVFHDAGADGPAGGNGGAADTAPGPMADAAIATGGADGGGSARGDGVAQDSPRSDLGVQDGRIDSDVPLGAADASEDGAIHGPADGGLGGDVTAASGVDATPVRDGAISRCPAAAPSSGAACDTARVCWYEDCAGPGRTAATCAQGAWSVTTVACKATVCRSGSSGASCDPGTLCMAIASGVPIAVCVTNTCGSNPISCDCLQSCTGTCGVGGSVADGITIACNPCPNGGCQ